MVSVKPWVQSPDRSRRGRHVRVRVCGPAELKFKVIFEYNGSSRLAWVM